MICIDIQFEITASGILIIFQQFLAHEKELDVAKRDSISNKFDKKYAKVNKMPHKLYIYCIFIELKI
jgi:hypothetical protein